MAICKPCEKSDTTTTIQFRGCRVGHALFNTLFAIAFGYAINFFCYGPTIPTLKPQGQVGGHLKYLTTWNFYAQFVISVLSVLVSITNFDRIRFLRDRFHHGIGIPYGFTVATMFWGLFYVDRNLIYPVALEAYIPSIVNHIIHTLVLIAPLFNELTYFMDRSCCTFQLMLVFGISYVSVLLYYAIVLDFWIYPVFNFLTTSQQALFIIGSLGVIITFYGLGSLIHRIRWRSALSTDSSTKKNK